MARTTDIEMFYFDDCPGYRQAWENILDALTETQIPARVSIARVDSMEKAEEVGFAGSPTIRINGRDLEDYDGPGILVCRVYRANDGKGWPGAKLIAERLRESAS